MYVDDSAGASSHSANHMYAAPPPSVAGDAATLAFLDRLAESGSEFGIQLRNALDKTVLDYTRQLIPPVAAERNGHRERLALAMYRFLSERGEPDPDGVCQQLLDRPVIQQADHSNLLFDQETFLNNFLFFMGCRGAGVRIMINSQCNTVSCLSRRRPVAGPVFLYTRKSAYRVFPLSKSQLKDSSFCALPAPLTMTLELEEGGRAAQDDPVLQTFVGRRLADPSNGYRTCNDEIWRMLKLDHDYRRVAIDETVASHAAALHFLDRNSPVHRLVFDPAVRDTFLRVKRRVVDLRENLGVNRALPDFFWFRVNTRLASVAVDGSGATARYVLEEDRSPLPVDATPRAIAAALDSGALYVDRILAYTVRCLLPGVVAIGGSIQQDYVAMYRRMLLETHAETPFLSEEDVRTLRTDGLSRLGGRPLLEPTADEAELIAMLGPDTDLDSFASSIGGRPLSRAIGFLSSVRFYEQILTRAQERSR